MISQALGLSIIAAALVGAVAISWLGLRCRKLGADLIACAKREDRLRFDLEGLESLRKDLARQLEQSLRREQDRSGSLRLWQELDAANRAMIERLRAEVQHLRGAPQGRRSPVDFDTTDPTSYPMLTGAGDSSPMPLDLLPPEAWRRTK